MTRSIVLTKDTDIAAIQQFFAEAGPDARIRARKNADETAVELYVRDLSLTGRLQEWWNTKSDERKGCYQQAKKSLELIIRDSKPEDHVYFKSKFEAHKQDFFGEEILGLQKQLDAKHTVEKALNQKFNLTLQLKTQYPGIQQKQSKPPQELVALDENLQASDPKKITTLLSKVLGKEYKLTDLQRNFNEFREFIHFKCGAENSNDDGMKFDFVAIENFLRAAKQAASIRHQRESSPQSIHKDSEELNNIGQTLTDEEKTAFHSSLDFAM